ncbi:MAG: lipase family protein [Sporomusaceae bacterium]|nr:lipase family protein [Sporomusaceae bacterium]
MGKVCFWRQKIFVVLCVLLLLPTAASAERAKLVFDENPAKLLKVEKKEDLKNYIEAHETFIAAAACLAAYHDRYGSMAIKALEEEGWDIIPYEHKGKDADARFFLAKKQFPGETRPFYLIAVTGTENSADISVDLRWGKIPFAPETYKTLNSNAAKVENDEPLVHEGFYQYEQTAEKARFGQTLGAANDILQELKDHPDQKLFLVGHSLGGAVATLGGAQMIADGIQPSQIRVITFGAPAVGNEGFKRIIGSKLKLLRVTMQGDPIPTVLRDIPGGYVQFGRELHFDVPDYFFYSPHDITLYMDLALKRYFDARAQAAVTAGRLYPKQRTVAGSPLVYVASLRAALPEKLQSEQPYMVEMLQLEASRFLPSYFLGEAASSDQAAIIAAREAGCDYVLVTELVAKRSKDNADTYDMTVEKRFYRVFDAKLLRQDMLSASTEKLTPLEVFFQTVKDVRGKYQEVIDRAS